MIFPNDSSKIFNKFQTIKCSAFKACFIAALAVMLILPHQAQAVCKTTFVNPLTDPAWPCMFPIRLAGIALTPSAPDPETYVSAPLCSCQDGAFKRVGFTMGFREPSYMVDVTKDSWCFAGLGLDMGKSSVWGDGSEGGLAGKKSMAELYYANTHSYYYNPLYILEILLDAKCLDKAPMAITDISEIRPDHNDAVLNLMMYPQSLLFSNPVSVAVCMADSIAATTGYPLDALFWCAGTWGPVYPLTGHSTVKGNTNISASANVAVKSIARAHNNLMLWGTKGEAALCGFYPQPVTMKSQYKIQPVRPLQTGSCVPIGRSELLWGAGNNPPAPGKADNFAYLLWRWRDCCAF